MLPLLYFCRYQYVIFLFSLVFITGLEQKVSKPFRQYCHLLPAFYCLNDLSVVVGTLHHRSENHSAAKSNVCQDYKFFLFLMH